MSYTKTEITKRQAAALLRGKLLPYCGYATALDDGRLVSHGPDRKFYLLTPADEKR